METKNASLALILFICIYSFTASAAEEFILDSVQIFGDREKFEEPGSYYKVQKEKIQRAQTHNAHDILKTVPGVTVQEEDGLGLRLNIGLRGATPHRSKKITLMEDGIMIAPAPYSAPAAYYTPMFAKITGLEVYKGPSSIKYGPNSIGGAVNFVTRPLRSESQVNYSYGSFNTQKLSAWHSDKVGRFQYLVEYDLLDSDGFKELEGTDLSFYKNNVLTKARYTFNTEKARVLDFKFNWSHENSNESYMGITEADFNSAPYTRYQASERDHFKWYHQQYNLKYLHQWSDVLFSDLTLYRNNFDRNWSKMNGFKDTGVQIQDVLLNPVGQNQDYLAVLKGEKNSDSSELLEYGLNKRSYYSQGAQLNTVYDDIENLKIEWGLLYHEDEIERFHELQDYNMDTTDGLIASGARRIDEGNQNIDSANVFRTYLLNTHRLLDNKKLVLRYGARYEHISLSREYKFSGTNSHRDLNIFVPGGGASYKFNTKNLAFFNVNLGVTPPGPGQARNVEPEESTNFELGYRHQSSHQNVELVAFYNDYQNILGTCTFSTGCSQSNLDTQFNGGEALIYGLEFLWNYTYQKDKNAFPVEVSSTYTHAEFNNTFTSSNPEWIGTGNNEVVRSGDPLPYIPELTFNASLGYQRKAFRADLKYTYQSKVFDQASLNGRREIDEFGIWTLQTSYNINKKLKAYLNVSNLLDDSYVTSLRPFGLRPGAPRWFTTGINYTF